MFILIVLELEFSKLHLISQHVCLKPHFLQSSWNASMHLFGNYFVDLSTLTVISSYWDIKQQAVVDRSSDTVTNGLNVKVIMGF